MSASAGAMELRLAARRAEREQALALRRLTLTESGPPGRLWRQGRLLVDCASNDYLGLSRHPQVIEAFRRGAEDGVGATSAPLISGHRPAHQALEVALAEFLGQPAALMFSSGYQANLGVLQALLEPQDLLVQDRLNHACLIDGARLAGCTARRYRHGDPASAAQQLAAPCQGVRLLATDGVFSMDGDLAPLSELAVIAESASAWLMVDDAHGFGVLGREGRGSIDASGLAPERVQVHLVTLGKALGVAGACVLGSEALIGHLLQSARTYVFSTAAPPALASAALAALVLMQEEPEHQLQLQRHIHRFRDGAAALGLPLLPSVTAIQPLILGDNQSALAASEALLTAGYWVPAIRPPTVPAGQARLRVSLSASLSEADIDGLLAALGAVLGARQ